MATGLRTYIIHVSDDHVREQHMNNQLNDKELEFTYIFEGDKKDLSDQVLDRYFTGNMKKVSNSTSCVYKHILAYETVVKNNDQMALILEDDIVFYHKFSEYLTQFIEEIKNKGLENYIISLEDSRLLYINRSERTKGSFIYQKEKGRYAGAYLIDNKCARNILEQIDDRKCAVPMDWYHNECSKNESINIYWSQPTIAVQKSHIGSMKTLLDNKTSGIFRVFSFYLQRTYKRVLYYFR